VTPSPITPDIIKLVHTIAKQEEMPKGLKISNRYGTVLFDSSWIAGVEYNEDLFEDKDYDSNDDDEDNNKEEEQFDAMDPNEVADILQDRTQNAGVDEPQEPQEFQNEEEEIVFEEEPEEEQQEEQTEDTPAEKAEDNPHYTIRSGRISRPPERLNVYQAQQHLETTDAPVKEYTRETAKVIANNICHWNNVCQHFGDKMLMMFIQTYSLNKGIKKFGQNGMDAATKEMKQLHNRTVFEGIKIEDMTPLDRKRAMESLLLLVEKRDGSQDQGKNSC
jgi:hypothetical protein